MKVLTVPPTIADLLVAGTAALEGAGLPTPGRDAEWLLADALGIGRLGLLLEAGRAVPLERTVRFGGAIERRKAHEPLQHILGFEEFRGLRFKTSPAALIPRPETELLVEWALELEGRHGPWRVAVDVGAGTGAIACALAAEAPHLAVVATERAPGALALAAANVRALGLAAQVRLVAGDLLEPLGGLAGAVDLVVSNPPYIATAALGHLPREVGDWEPREALDGGPDGMAIHRRLVAESPRFLRSGGWLLMETGEEQQAGPLTAAMEVNGFDSVEVRRDLRGAERMIAGRRR